jgi:hypothetical protein
MNLEQSITEIEEVKNLPTEYSSEIDVQIATAHRYPRSIERFKKMALAIATSDQETAESCFYVLPRGGKSIEGPGVRLAEIIGSSWGNMRYGARIVGEDDKFIIAHGMAHDLERNVAMTIEVRRRITDKYGKKYNDDMISTTANAACSIALRNAIFKVVPKAFIDSIYKAAKKVAVGDTQTLNDRRHKMMDYFGKMGVSKDRVFAAMGINGIEDVNLEILEKLIGLSTAIKDGDINVDAAFPIISIIKSDATATKTESVAQKIKASAEKLKEREPGEEG